MVFMLDNYDSFVYNLVQYLEILDCRVVVSRNDRTTPEEISKLKPSHIIISPGPCAPDQAGISLELINYFCGKVPIMGVCLGHQAIGQAFGGRVVRSPRPMHGKTSLIEHDGLGVFKTLPGPLAVGRYHSLVVSNEGLPGCLEVTARAKTGEIMGLRHREYAVEGVQFHPESVLTPQGMQMLQNFLRGGGTAA